MSTRLRPAHGVALLFLANGLAHPSLWPRFPELREALGASPGTFGLALLGMGLGGAVGSLAAGAVTRRVGPVRAATGSAVVLAVAAVAVGLAPTLPALFVAFAALGTLDGVADTSQNALLFTVQRRGERWLASRMHAVWSAGALAGTATGTLAATLGRGIVEQLVLLAVVALVLVAVALPALRGLRGDVQVPVVPTAGADAAPPAPAGEPAARARSSGRTAAWALLVATGAVVAAVESTANEWSALTLRDGLGASLTLAGLGPTVYAGAMLVGRLVGDRVLDRVGPVTTARAGAGAVLVGGGGGLALAALADTPVALVVGLVAAGLGTATLFPLMMAAGDRLDPSGRGVAAGSFGARVGFLLVPLAVGGLGEAFGLVVAFTVLPATALAALLALPAALRR